jgi:hypothetical protein
VGGAVSRRTSVDFLVLGSWEVLDGVRRVPVPAGQMPVLLAALHTYVARLRRLLGREVIQTSQDGYRLAVATSQVDLWRFRDLSARADKAGSADAELLAAHPVEQRHPQRYELPELIRRFAASLTDGP